MSTDYANFNSAGICETLLDYTRFADDNNSFFYKYHYKYPKETYGSKWEDKKNRFPNHLDLEDFLKATNDEVRLKKADNYSTGILYIPDMKDAVYFRDAIMRKELSADLDYSKQRDHAAHTLYNYLLGWYFFENCIPIQDNIKQQISIRDIQLFDDSEEKNLICSFGAIWTYASLLHDIGYLLEGSLSNLSPDVEIAHVTRGAAIIHDYFNHYFWKDIDLDFYAARGVIKQLKLYVPDFKSIKSIAALSDHLCVMGDCEPIRQKLEKELAGNDILKKKFNKILEKPNTLDVDSFKLWEMHYSINQNKETANLIIAINKKYKELVWDGLPQSNSRTINHAVASGLLSLMFSTFFYQILFGLKQVEEFRTDIKNDLNTLGGIIQYVKNRSNVTKPGKKIKFPPYKLLTNSIKKHIIFGYEYGILYRDNKLLDILYSMIFEIEDFINLENGKIDTIKNKFTRLNNLIEGELKLFYKKYNYTAVRDFFNDELIPIHFDKYTAKNWFSLVLWGTAAAAVHDIVQNKKLWDNEKHIKDFTKIQKNRLSKNQGLLSLAESPLCYLGVLVDAIQEWDRYSVRKDDVFSTKDRLQGVQVNIEYMTGSNKLKFTFPDSDDLSETIQKTLNFSLEKWKDYLQLNNGIYI